MGVFELVLMGVGLSMDAFAVALCKGLCMPKIHWGQAFAIAIAFGGFQALMPLIGWAAGSLFASYIMAVDHWVAFGLLFIIGAKMIWDTINEESEVENTDCAPRLDIRELLLLALATSIDALAVGITLAFLQVNIIFAASIIGVITCLLSFFGVMLGHQFGSRFEKPAAIFGGIVLIALGFKILLEHLEIV